MSATNETVAEHIDAASSEAVAQAVKESSVSDARDDSPWLGHLIRGMTTLLIVLVTLVAYHFLMVVPNKQKFAVVDIGEVLNIKELQVTIAAMKPDSQLQQTQAFEEIAKFAKGIEDALNEMQQDCGCSIFVKAAVVKAAGAVDLTAELKQRMGLDNVNQAELAQQLRTVGGRGPAPMLEAPKR